MDVSDRRGCVKGFLGEWTGKKGNKGDQERNRAHRDRERDL